MFDKIVITGLLGIEVEVEVLLMILFVVIFMALFVALFMVLFVTLFMVLFMAMLVVIFMVMFVFLDCLFRMVVSPIFTSVQIILSHILCPSGPIPHRSPYPPSAPQQSIPQSRPAYLTLSSLHPKSAHLLLISIPIIFTPIIG